jgi:diadenosine tetraphosphate (Ap4A) HIT family hydrolase
MCILCERVKLKEDNPHFIYEFKNSVLFVGEHQFFPGYCVLYLKDHKTDLSLLTPEVQEEFFSEVMRSANAIKQIFSPTKLNYSCLGNVVDHIHYHIFPRYDVELNKQIKKDPWANDHLFSKHLTTNDMARNISEKLYAELSK